MARYKTVHIAAPYGEATLTFSGYGPVGSSNAFWSGGAYHTENWERIRFPTAGTITSLWVKRQSSPSGTHTLYLRQNYADSGLQVTTTAASQAAEDAATSVAVAAGDYLAFRSSGGSAYEVVRFLFEPTADATQLCIYTANGVTSSVGIASTSATNFLPFCGRLSGTTLTESQAQMRMKLAGTVSNARIAVLNNDGLIYTNHSPAVTIRSRKNGAYGNITFTYPPSGDGAQVDDSNTDTLAIDDLYCWEVSQITSGGTRATNISFQYAHSVVNGEHEVFGHPNALALTVTASGSTRYWPIAGELQTPGTTESTVSATLGMTCGIKKFRARITTNNCSGDVTFAIYKNGIASAVTFVVGAGLTGDFIDDVNEVALASTDTASVAISGGTSGSFSLSYIAMVIPGAEVGAVASVSRSYNRVWG